MSLAQWLALWAAIDLAAVIAWSTHRTRQKNRSNTAMSAARLADTANDDQRSPDYCWTHGCHRSQCPQPH